MNGVQMGALRRIFGVDVEVVEDDRPYDNAQTIVRRFREGGYDDVIVVAPYSVLDRMCQLGLRPLWSDAEQVFDPKLADWRVRDRMYRFLGFKRVVMPSGSRRINRLKHADPSGAVWGNAPASELWRGEGENIW